MKWTCAKCGKMWNLAPESIPFHCSCQGQRSRGLGDTVAKVAARLGLRPCGGCKKRQRLLNRVVPYSNARHVR
jgi:hypothetical protein